MNPIQRQEWKEPNLVVLEVKETSAGAGFTNIDYISPDDKALFDS